MTHDKTDKRYLCFKRDNALRAITPLNMLIVHTTAHAAVLFKSRRDNDTGTRSERNLYFFCSVSYDNLYLSKPFCMKK